MLAHESLFGFASEDPTAFGMRLAEAAKRHAVYFDDVIGLPVVLRGSEINAMLRDEETFSNRAFAQGLMEGALIAAMGDDHTRMRKLYTGFFAPRHIKAYEETIVAPTVASVLDQLATQSQPDLLDHVCVEVPKRVVSALFGLPVERIDRNDELVRTILKAIIAPQHAEVVAAGAAAYAEMREELMSIAARELDNPSATMLGEIAKALTAEGNATVEACERIVFTLILGSYETTIWGLAWTLAALLLHPDTLVRVRDNPELLPNAIEESWRWCGGTLGTIRSVEREATIAGETFAAGSLLYLGWLASHFDADTYTNPARFDIDRKTKTMIFGGGPHFCVGAPLARMETRVTMSQLLSRFPNVRLDRERAAPKFETYVRGSVMFGPDHLPVVLG